MYKLLVVDDEPKIREVIREYAEFYGYEVSEAADGMSAVGLCKLNEYDLIILDIMMPKLDGYEACKEIKKLSDTPIIMLSARGEEYDKLHGFDLGIDDYVVKDRFSPKELMARIKVILERRNGVKTPASEEMNFGGLAVMSLGRLPQPLWGWTCTSTSIPSFSQILSARRCTTTAPDLSSESISISINIAFISRLQVLYPNVRHTRSRPFRHPGGTFP